MGNHTHHSTVSARNDGTASVEIPTVENRLPKFVPYPDSECCDSDHSHSKIGTPSSWAEEKTTAKQSISRFSESKPRGPTPFFDSSAYYSTAPPPEYLDYSSLVGIVKRLD